MESWDPYQNTDGPGCDDNQPKSCEDCALAEAALCTAKAYKKMRVKIQGKWTWVVTNLGSQATMAFSTQVGPRTAGDCFCHAEYDICNCANGKQERFDFFCV